MYFRKIIGPRPLCLMLISADQHSTSKKISAPLLERVIEQDHRSIGCSEFQQQIKAAVHTEKRSRLKQSAKNIHEQLPAPLQHSMELFQEKGASTWLTALPIDNHGFALHKTAFRDALSLRYGWAIKNSPSHCSCGHAFSIAHALSCPTGGYPSIRHNEIRDIWIWKHFQGSNIMLQLCCQSESF